MSESDVEVVLRESAAQLRLELASAQLTQLVRYVALVHKWQRVSNLTAAPSSLQFAHEHVVDCLAVVPHIPSGRLLDVGSGAGLPGIVVAIATPACAVTLLEPRSKRARFLTQVKIELGLVNVDIVTERVERWRPAQAYDAIIARAFGPLAHLLTATRGLLQPGTRLLAMKGCVDEDEIARCGRAAEVVQIVALNVPGFTARHLLVVDGADLQTGASGAGEPFRLMP